jgi:voltage-gated potassium channel
VLRVMRVMKLARYSSGMRSLVEALIDERRALWGCLMILACATLVAATAMYIAEGKVQPDKLGTIPEAAWWAIVTLGTIGYGDVIPMTPAGRLVASITIVTGLVMIALPVGIVATAFAEVIHRREFIVTWSMVARVPLFADLKAGDIAHIMQLLRAERFDRGDVIARRGDVAHSMYFVASGEVQIDIAASDTGGPVRLGPGHFFGELAALKRTRRSATVRASSRVNLLALDVADLRALMLREPAIAERVLAVARERAGGDIDGLQGDLIAAELSGGDAATNV